MADEEPTSAWSPLRYPVFRALWIASLVSNIGTWMQNVGGVWLMSSLSPSPFLVALMQTATSLPVFLVGIPAGALADIVNRRRLLLCTQGLMLIAAAVLSTVTIAEAIDARGLLALTFILGLGTALNTPTWQAVMPDLVSRRELSAAVALNGVTVNVGRAVGPALAGVVVAAAGPGAVFFLNTLSFVGVLVVLYRWPAKFAESVLPAERVLGATRAGLRYIRYAPEIRAVLVRAGVFIAAGSALWALLPALARREIGLGAAGFGLLLGCIGLGAIGGATFLQRVRRQYSLDQVLVAAFRLVLGGFQTCENFLDAVDRGENQRDRFGGDRHAVAEFAHQGLAGMGQRLQPRQSQKAAGAFNGVNQPENIVENLCVVRLLLKPNQLIVNRVQALAGLGQKLAQQIVHETGLTQHGARDIATPLEFRQLLWKRFNIG